MKGFNNKTWVFGAIATVLLIAIIMPSVPSASSVTITLCDSLTIDPALSPYDNILVQKGIDCHMGPNIVVLGNVQVESGAIFSSNGGVAGVVTSTIHGNLLADGAKSISLAALDVGGNVLIKNIDTN